MAKPRTKIFLRRRFVFPRPRQRIPLGFRKFRAKSFIPRRIIIVGRSRRGFFLYKRRRQPRRMFRRFWNPFQLLMMGKQEYRFNNYGTPSRVGVSKFGLSKEVLSQLTSKWQRVWKNKLGTFTDGVKPLWINKYTDEERARIAIKKKLKPTKQKAFKKKHPNWGGLRVKDVRTVFDKNGNFKLKFEHYQGYKNEILKRNFGKYPKEIDPKLIVEIRPTVAFKRDILKLSEEDRRRYLRIIAASIEKFKIDLLTHAKTKIERYVPKREGTLRKSMYKSLEKCDRIGAGIKIEMSAKVPHAGVVQRMPADRPPNPPFAHLRHYNEWSRGILLNDPNAQTTSFTYVMMILKTHAKTLWYDFLANLTNKLGYYQYKGGIRQTFKKPVGKRVEYMKGLGRKTVSLQRFTPEWERMIKIYREHMGEKEDTPYEFRDMSWKRKSGLGKGVDDIWDFSYTTYKREEKIIPFTESEWEDIRDIHFMKSWNKYDKLEKEWIKVSIETVRSWFKIKGLYKGKGT